MRGSRKHGRAETAWRHFRRLAADTSATTAIEYTLIAAGISVAIAATVAGMGSSLSGKYEDVNDGFTSLRSPG